MITSLVLPWVAGVFVLAMLLTAWRLFRGPDAEDRVLALDTLYVNAMALLIVIGLMLGSKIVFEVALLTALFGFVGTVVLARYLLRGSVIE